MTELPANLASHLAGGSTTLCTCWRLIRRDGAVFGFTDHDEDIIFSGTTFRAGAGLSGSEVESALGLAVGGGDVTGALVSDAVSETDILAGRLDGASIETWLVNWADLTARTLLDVSTIGEIKRADNAFTAELRNAFAPYDEEKGRLYGPRCDAAFGDARCGLSLAATNRRVTAVVSAVESSSAFTIATPPGIAARAFVEGRAEILGGSAAGLVAGIASHDRSGGIDRIGLDRAIAGIAAGDQVQLTIGCDKRFATCQAFGNTANFRGFPHIPTTDQAFAYADRGSGVNDGGSLFQ